MNISSGKIMSAQKVVLYGPEGIGKSTFAAQFPDPVFIDTEGSTRHMDVRRFDKPSSWTMLTEQVSYVRDHVDVCKTLVIDTADWAEKLAYRHICAEHNWKSIETPGYGTGYRYAYEAVGALLNLLDEVIGRGINVLLVAHAALRKFEQPDELGSYDRWELKLQNSQKCNTTAMIKEWADMVLFVNYQTMVVKDGTGEHAKSKAQGGKRVMYTSHHPCWDAKNRHDLPEVMDFDFRAIAHCFPSGAAIAEQTPPRQQSASADSSAHKETAVQPESGVNSGLSEGTPDSSRTDIPKALSDLMTAHNVTDDMIRTVVSERGYFPYSTPIASYGKDFINGALIAGWSQLLPLLENVRDINF